MALSERDRRALIVGGAALLVLALYFGVVEPVGGGYQHMVKDHDSTAARLARVLSDRQRRVYRLEQVRDWEAKTGPLGAPKPHDQAISTVGSAIVAAAQSNNIELQGATPGAATPWGPDPQLLQSIVQIDAKSEWENVFKFIAALYKIDGVLSVEQMDLSGDPKNPGKLSLKLGVSVLLQGDAAGGGKWPR